MFEHHHFAPSSALVSRQRPNGHEDDPFQGRLRRALEDLPSLCENQQGPSSWDATRRWALLLPLAAWGWLVTVASLAFGHTSGPIRGTLGLGELCPAARSARDNAQNSLALFTVYNRFGSYGLELPEAGRRFSAGLFHSRNAQGVRNRLELVVASLVAAIDARCPQDGTIDLLSIASGSAQAVWMAMQELERRGSTRTIRVLLVDRDPGSHEHARSLAQRFGYEHCLTTVVGTASGFASICEEHGFEPAIIEMAGFLDYRSDEQATRLMSSISRSLGPHGLFVSCHIHPNPEIPFVRWALGWPMRYRTTAQFRSLIERSGFALEAFLTEPQGVHSVVVAQPETL